MADKSQNTVGSYVNQIESKLEEVFTGKKIPALPDNVKEILVKLNPWFALFMMITLLPLLLAALGLSAVLLPISFIGGFQTGIGGTLGLIFGIAMIIIELMAIPGLFKRQAKAWKLMFYVTLLSALQNILSFNLGGLIIGGAISCYFLFQIKSKYNK